MLKSMDNRACSKFAITSGRHITNCRPWSGAVPGCQDQFAPTTYTQLTNPSYTLIPAFGDSPHLPECRESAQDYPTLQAGCMMRISQFRMILVPRSVLLHPKQGKLRRFLHNGPTEGPNRTPAFNNRTVHITNIDAGLAATTQAHILTLADFAGIITGVSQRQ
jgi:hypothetical protein